MTVVEESVGVVLTRALQNSIATRVGSNEGGDIIDLAFNDEPQISAFVVLRYFLYSELLEVSVYSG